MTGDPDDSALPEQRVGTRQYAIAFSPDGRFLATGGAHGRNGVQLWEVATGKKIRTLQAGLGERWIHRVAFSADGRRLFSRGNDALRISDTETGELLGSIGGSKDPPGVSSFVLSPDLRRLAVYRGKIILYDLAADGFSKVLLEIPQDLRDSHLSFSPDGRRLMASGSGDSVIYDSFTGESQLTLRGGCSRASFLADSQRVISTDGDRRVKIWDAAINRELVRMTNGYAPVAIAKDGSRLVVHLPLDETNGLTSKKSPFNTGGLGVLDTMTGRLISTMREHEPEMVDGAAFSPDNKWVASGGRDAGGTMRIWDAQTGQVKLMVPTPRTEHYMIGFGPRGDIVSSTLERAMRHVFWDIATGVEKFSVRHAMNSSVWAMSPDGHRFATGDIEGNLSVWDTATGDELRKWKGHARGEFSAFRVAINECMDYSADGRHLVTGGEDGLVKLWNPETGQLERTFSGHRGVVIGVHFTPDQRRLISQGGDGTVRIWDPATGKELLSLADPLFTKAYKWFVTVSPDGRRLFAAPGDKKEMILWEVATPAQVVAWQREEAADAALWAAEQPKVEARRLARLSDATRN